MNEIMIHMNIVLISIALIGLFLELVSAVLGIGWLVVGFFVVCVASWILSMFIKS